jgi:transcription elongation factor Elf1
MTRIKTHTLDCQKCGNKVPIEEYKSVNVTRDPELKEKVLNDEINTAVCDSCGQVYRLGEPFLYHDMDAGQMIWIYPKHMKDKAQEIKGEIEKADQEVLDSINSRYGEDIDKDKLAKSQSIKSQVVFGIEELKQKIE